MDGGEGVDILRLSREGGACGTCTWAITPPSFEDLGNVVLCCPTVVPGLTRLRLGVKHWVHLRALGQLKYVHNGHAHLLSSAELGVAVTEIMR